jgi:hypothetical protein
VCRWLRHPDLRGEFGIQEFVNVKTVRIEEV